MKKILFIALLCCLQSVFAQEVFTPELLWKFGRVSAPVVSPDGKSVVYEVRYFNVEANKGNTDLYVIPVSGGTPRRLTDLSGTESNARWRPDGKKIGFLSSESGSSQLWEINPDGSGLKQVSKLEGDLTGFNYSPKGSFIYFTKEVQIGKTVQDLYPDLPKANARIIDGLMYKHWDTWEDGAHSHVFFAKYADGNLIGNPTDIMPGEPYDAPMMPFGGEEQLNWSPDEKIIAYTSKKLSGTAYATSTNSEIYLYYLDNGKTENISTGMPGYDVEPRFSPDGSSLAWLSMERPGFEADRNRIFHLDFNSGIRQELTEGFDQSASSLTWSADGKTLYFESATQATVQLYALQPDIKKGSKIRQITTGLNDYTAFDLAEDGKNTYLIGTRVNMSTPAELYRVDAKNGAQAQLTFTNKELLGKVKAGEVKKRMVKTTDGMDMLTWVIYPPDFDPSKKYPTLLYCQGGPQSVISQNFSYRWNFQLMAANGYIVVAPNRRGLPSFGQAWNDQISGDWGGQAMKDYLSAIDDVSKESYVDRDKLGAVGASYGGYSVYWLAGNHNKRFKSFISHCGVFNLESMYGTTEEMFFVNHDLEGSYWKTPRPKSYEQFSPHKFVKNWDTPILVIHNEKDFRVPLSEGMQAFSAAQLQGIPSRFLYFENEGHWVTRPQNSILWQRVFFDWLDRTLKNPTKP